MKVLSSSARKDLPLQGHRHVANLVEEDGPAVGDLEEPFLLADRAGEGAFLITEHSLSKRLSGMAVQEISMNGSKARWLP